jgi:RimJ/RimL family protein N-acetyltransferase
MESSLLLGYRVRLRPFESDGLGGRAPWEHLSALGQQPDQPWLAGMQQSGIRWGEFAPRATRQSDTAQLVIESIAGEYAGIIGTHDCDRRNGTFSYGIAIHKGCERQGFGSEAILLVCRYYFEALHYQKVSTGVYSYNEPALRLHERLGFACEGCLRRMVYSGGQYYDRVLFGLMAEEFNERHANSLPGNK